MPSVEYRLSEGVILSMTYSIHLEAIHTFLNCETPTAWVDAALVNLDVLLIDHAHCEKKAASTALSFIYRYPNKTHLLQQMSRFAREELRHFEKVLSIMSKRSIVYQYLEPSRYASGLRTVVRSEEPAKLIDQLIIGAFIEARSCERFAKLVPYLDDGLARFYEGLLSSEARHFQGYLNLAEAAAGLAFDITARIEEIAILESSLISSTDPQFRFHSGVPPKTPPDG